MDIVQYIVMLLVLIYMAMSQNPRTLGTLK